MYKPSDKKENDHHNSDLYWPTSIQYTIQWFTFPTIMEHTENIIKFNKGIIPPLLKVFAMFELHLIDNRYKVEAIDMSCINL